MPHFVDGHHTMVNTSINSSIQMELLLIKKNVKEEFTNKKQRKITTFLNDRHKYRTPKIKASYLLIYDCCLRRIVA